MSDRSSAPSPRRTARVILHDGAGRVWLIQGCDPGLPERAPFWFTPGGKIEPGESLEQALRRELEEEIGLTIGATQLWRIEQVDYPHALVRLHFCKVFHWSGQMQMREGQDFAWQSLPVQVQPVLPGTVPVLQWFAQERGFSGPTHPA